MGTVDIILDDGGHTNLDQIITTVNVLDKINDNGLLVVEDVHTSYIQEYNSSIKFSFINFTNQLIYSIHYFDKMVIFRVNKHKCKFELAPTSNFGKNNNIENLTFQANELNINFIKYIFSKVPFFSLRKITKIIKNKVNNNVIKK